MIYRDEKRVVKGTVNRMGECETSRTVTIYGDSLPDVERFLRETPKKWTYEQSRENEASKSWDLGVGYKGAEKLAKDGWSEGAADLDHRLQAIMPAASREARYGHSVYGSSVNIGRYLNGNPNNMRRRGKREAGSAPVFHIIVNAVATCMVNAQHFANYGTAIVGLIDRLEATGKRCMVDVVFCTLLPNDGKYGDVRGVVGWNVKQANEAVDLAAVAFSIGHPAAFRRIGFAMMERLPKGTEHSGYGQSLDVHESDVIDPTDGTMLLDGVNHETSRCSTPEGALKLAIEQLNKAAVKAGHATIDNPLIDETDAMN